MGKLHEQSRSCGLGSAPPILEEFWVSRKFTDLRIFTGRASKLHSQLAGRVSSMKKVWKIGRCHHLKLLKAAKCLKRVEKLSTF